MTRAEHLDWCKARAREYLETGDLAQAVASMTSDMRKHPETERSMDPLIAMLGMQETLKGRDAVRRWIEGFQ
ncbi:hypothetical protein [Microvirga massiliensis]|uniref:hypothetical protein n=1 Tax=Microvirga massiliensis TaxID=1033741 RepID=UPI00062B6972|nr:hypothetical protein [Microvirga massiliensis]